MIGKQHFQKVINTNLGDRLAIARRKGLAEKESPAKIAEALGFNTRQLYYHRERQDDLSFKEILKLCIYFEISLSEFLGIPEEDFNPDNTLNDTLTIYQQKKKLYIEERIDLLQKQVDELKKKMLKQ
jgi:transcriptional regulator with XRE-family HTH domain